MINSYLSRQITQNFPYDPTEDQVLALNLLSNFLLSEESDSLLLLKGYAGTGKTSLVGALVKTMTELKQKSILLAPTGRAAKGIFRLCRTESIYDTQEDISPESLFQRTDRFSFG